LAALCHVFSQSSYSLRGKYPISEWNSVIEKLHHDKTNLSSSKWAWDTSSFIIGSFIIGYISIYRSTNSPSDLLANQEYWLPNIKDEKCLQSHLGVTVGQPKSYRKLQHFLKIIRTDTEFRKMLSTVYRLVLRNKEMKKIRRG